MQMLAGKSKEVPDSCAMFVNLFVVLGAVTDRFFSFLLGRPNVSEICGNGSGNLVILFQIFSIIM